MRSHSRLRTAVTVLLMEKVTINIAGRPIVDNNIYRVITYIRNIGERERGEEEAKHTRLYMHASTSTATSMLR